MLLYKTISSLPPLLLFCFTLQHFTSLASAATLPQSKNQQISPQQQQQQQQQHLQASLQQKSTHQQQQHQQNPQHQHQQQQSQSHLHQAQYVHEKDPMRESMKHINSEEEYNNPYQILNDLKHEPMIPTWNPYAPPQHSMPPAQQSQPVPSAMNPQQSAAYENFPPAAFNTPKYIPFIGYPQPVFIPYPLYISPEMFYSTFDGTTNDIEDSMARAGGMRRPGASSPYQRNSPIHYVRLPPTPYMFLPSLGYGFSPSTAATFGSGFPSVLSYQSLPTLPALSPIFNLPMNFLANGKPTNIYQMGGSPNDIQNALHIGSINSFGSGSRPLPLNPYKPGGVSNSYLPQPPYGFPSPPSPHQESKLTSLKRPFIFNGRPEDIYTLPNNFNPLYSGSDYY